MWYIISFIAGFIAAMVIVEWRTGIFVSWLAAKIDRWAAKFEKKKEE
jgi:hypothetical protein